MTRKRFVRLVMAARIDRDTANRFADSVRDRGLPYAVAHRVVKDALRIFACFPISGARVTIRLDDHAEAEM